MPNNLNNFRILKFKIINKVNLHVKKKVPTYKNLKNMNCILYNLNIAIYRLNKLIKRLLSRVYKS